MSEQLPSGVAQHEVRNDPREPEERNLPHVARRYALLRLFDFFRVGNRQIHFAEEFDMLLRSGYRGRNPANGSHERGLIAVADLFETGRLLEARPVGIGNTAKSAVLLGLPGMGKTLAVEQTLSAYRQAVSHDGLPTQIVWLKLECPPRGSIRTLCTDFFAEMDRLLGEPRYKALYGHTSAPEETMMGQMAILSNLHGLGCLVIDEVQNLGRIRGEEHVLMTFLTALTNQLGVPVLMIGTYSALTLFQRTARMGRRSVGPASMTWDRLTNADEWRAFLDDLWQYQWTNEATPLDDTLRKCLYDETQGVLDLLVKLYVKVQMRLIFRSEVQPGSSEIITPDFIRNAAAVDLRPVSGMLAALQSGDPRKIARFEDLAAFHAQYASSLSFTVTGSVGAGAGPILPPSLNNPKQLAPIEPNQSETLLWHQLRKQRLPDDVIMALLDEVRQSGLSIENDPIEAYERIKKRLAQKKKVDRASRAAVAAQPYAEDDLRAIVSAAPEKGLSAYEALVAAGLAGPTALPLSA